MTRASVWTVVMALWLGVGGVAAARAPQGGEVRVGSATALPAGADWGASAPGNRAFHFEIALAPRDPQALSALVRAVSGPGAVAGRRYVTAAQFGRRFGASPRGVLTVRAALRRWGLRVGRLATNRLLLPVSGTARQISRALRARIDAVGRSAHALRFANRDAPRLPARAARYVQGIIGLDDLGTASGSPPRVVSASRTHLHAHAAVATGGPQPCTAATNEATSQYAGSTGNLAYRSGYTADQLATVYGFSSLYSGGDTGAGQTVALLEEVPYAPGDIQTFQNCYATNASVTNVTVGAGVGTAPGNGEAAVDIETVIGLAPGANIIVYEGTDPLADLARIVSDNQAKTVATAWPSCETGSTSSLAASYSTLLQEAAAQGQSVLAAAGDHGSSCTAANFTSAPGTELPASDPDVTAVGGTTLYSLSGTTAEPYATGRNPVQSVWNNGMQATPVGGGGGLSIFSAMPSYQSGAASSLGVVNAESGGTCSSPPCREVPDVSADGDPGSGYTVYGNGSWSVAGGTGTSTSLWAAFTALADASPTCRGFSLGLLNPSLYRLAGSGAGPFTDVVNASPRTGAGNNDAAGIFSGHYAVRTGYDMATGLGSMNAAPLASALCQGRAPVYSVTVSNPGAQTTTSAAPVSLQLAGSDSGSEPLTYTATGLPVGLSISSSGLITGAPTTPGSYSVTVTASDSVANQGTTTFAWTVTQPSVVPPPPIGSPPPSPLRWSTRGRVRLTVHHGRYTVSPGITGSCPKSGPTCTFTIAATTTNRVTQHHKHRTIKLTVARVRGTVRQGRQTTVSFSLPRSIVRLLLAHHRLTIAVTASGRAGTSRLVTAHRTVTIKPPKPSKPGRRKR